MRRLISAPFTGGVRSYLVNPLGDSISKLAPGKASLRGRVQRTRVKGKIGFLLLRQSPTESVQIVVEDASLLEILKNCTPESIVDVSGEVVTVPKPVTGSSRNDIEMKATALSAVTIAETPLPFPFSDTTTKLDTRLDNRVIDIRTPFTNAVLQLSSRVNKYFRNHLIAHDFTEIHSPKMIGTPSEGGSSVFNLDYFGQKAFLAQSPQLFKQMGIQGDIHRVFEVGPVFRAEKSLTHRHLTEFVGLDAEMIIRESHVEVLHMLEGTMHAILSGLMSAECAPFVATVEEHENRKLEPIVLCMEQSKMEELGVGEDDTPLKQRTLLQSDNSGDQQSSVSASKDKYGARVGSKAERPMLRIPFDGAMQLLVDNKVIEAPLDDFDLPMEKEMGKIVKERYGVDIFVVDCFPLSARPFYTMPEPGRPDRTRSFDMYLRGQEISSGAQRIHDPKLLLKRAEECNVNPVHLKDYIDAFRYGAYPHGGFGLGLERIVLFFLGIHDVRMVSMFPRDPKRITP